MAGAIFISYRRHDTAHATGRLYGELRSAFQDGQLFMDVDNIRAGQDFVRVLEKKVNQCDVLLAVIGPRWLDAKNERGERRIDLPEDFVRIEIESALKLNKLVIPILVDGAQMPPSDQLPPSLRGLARRHAIPLSHERFRADAARLVDDLRATFDEVDETLHTIPPRPAADGEPAPAPPKSPFSSENASALLWNLWKQRQGPAGEASDPERPPAWIESVRATQKAVNRTVAPIMMIVGGLIFVFGGIAGIAVGLDPEVSEGGVGAIIIGGALIYFGQRARALIRAGKIPWWISG